MMSRSALLLPILVVTTLAGQDAAQWQQDEAKFLTNIKQITQNFARAGEM